MSGKIKKAVSKEDCSETEVLEQSLVRETGLEPAQLAPPAPQAGVSTNSTTPAGVFFINTTGLSIAKTDFAVNTPF